MAFFYFAYPPLEAVGIYLQVAEEQRRVAGRGSDGHVIRGDR
jgi:hypothetical protein